MKTSGKLFALTPRNGRLARPNGIFGPDDNFSDVSSTSSSDEDSPNDWVDPLWIPDDNLCQYPSSQVNAQRIKKINIINTKQHQRNLINSPIQTTKHPLRRTSLHARSTKGCTPTPSSPSLSCGQETTSASNGKPSSPAIYRAVSRRRNSSLTRNRTRRVYVKDRSCVHPHEEMIGPAAGRRISSLLASSDTFRLAHRDRPASLSLYPSSLTKSFAGFSSEKNQNGRYVKTFVFFFLRLPSLYVSL